jgi:hypothetical protein
MHVGLSRTNMVIGTGKQTAAPTRIRLMSFREREITDVSNQVCRSETKEYQHRSLARYRYCQSTQPLHTDQPVNQEHARQDVFGKARDDVARRRRCGDAG